MARRSDLYRLDRWAVDRVGLDALRQQSEDRLHLVPGWLRDGMCVLRERANGLRAAILARAEIFEQAMIFARDLAARTANALAMLSLWEWANLSTITMQSLEADPLA